MASAYNQGYVKSVMTGILGLPMMQGAVSTESKSLSLILLTFTWPCSLPATPSINASEVSSELLTAEEGVWLSAHPVIRVRAILPTTSTSMAGHRITAHEAEK